MKKITLLTLAVCAGMALFAQSTQLVTPMSAKTRFGIKAGANFPRFNFNPDNFPAGANIAHTTSKASINAGVFVNIPISTLFRFQPELVYSGQGSRLDWSNGSQNFKADWNYINLPLMIQLQTKGGFVIETGPQFGLLRSAMIENSTGNSTKSEITDQMDAFDFSWGGGVGYLSRIGLGIGVRYNLGITNILNKDKAGTQTTYFGNGSMKNSVLQVDLCYQFGAYK